MLEGFKKFNLVLIILTCLLGAAYIKIEKIEKQEDVLSILDGRTVFASSPEKYYLETQVNKYDAESDWHPGEKFGTSDQPMILGESALLVDIDTNKILYEKDSTKKMKIASLTKIMTAVIALEHKDLDSKIYVTRDAAYVEENTMYLTTGEVYTLRELLLGLILNSGNDGAYAIADGVAGDFVTFVEWMNIKAKELGLNNTYFADPSGLNDDTYSTVEDLVKLSRYALKNPEFREIAKTTVAELTSETHKYVYLENQTNLLTTYPGVEGIKTGYTEEAGLCLATYANYQGHRVVGVVLNSIDRKGDMILMLNHGFNNLGAGVPYAL